MKFTGPQATIIAAVMAVIGIVLGSVLTPIVEKMVNQPPPASIPAELVIEEIPQDVFAYKDGGASIFVLTHDQERVPNYKLDYALPIDQPGYAGLAFNFHAGSNLSAYSAIECILQFTDTPNEIDLYIKDIGGNFNTIRVVSTEANEMALRYEFRNFPDINFNAVKEVGVVANAGFSTGIHEVILKHVRFVN